MLADLKNKRGITVLNFLHNSPFAFLNMLFTPYAARLRIIPETQVAAQQGVQARDLTSFLAGVQCWAARNSVNVYALQRDQMKGFDYLRPEGFYDSVRVYGLPASIIALDKSTQSNNRCTIRTTYGFTAAISIDGVTKQGASLSSTKSVFTTSMGHRYIQDLFAHNPDVLCIRSISAAHARPHLPADLLELLVLMAEATDNSYCFALSMDALYRIALVLEHFQYAYGWLTSWPKSRAYILGPAPVAAPETMTFGSVSTASGTNYSTIVKHSVPVCMDGLEFMNTKINNPKTRAAIIRDIVDQFQIPAFATRVPITVIRKAYKQSVIPRARALLALQPISTADAEDIDAHVMARVHGMLSQAFCPNSHILTLPVSLHGMGWSSIARINAAIAVEGLARDLNHHVPAYRTMRRSPWQTGRARSRAVSTRSRVLVSNARTRSLAKSIPAAWIIAHKKMASMNPLLSLKCTDISYITRGELSIAHVINELKSTGQITSDVLSVQAVTVITSQGISRLCDIGSWTCAPTGIEFYAHSTYPCAIAPKRKDRGPARWLEVAKTLDKTPISALVSGDLDPLVSHEKRQEHAEQLIRTAADSSTLPPLHNSPLWASDGSMTPGAAKRQDARQVTAAVVGPQSLVMKVAYRAASNLHGEVTALGAASLLPRSPGHLLCSDHANSVNLTMDKTFMTGDENRIRRANGKSLYRWLRTNLQRPNAPTIQYTRAHQTDDTVETRANQAADHYATSAQDHFAHLPPAPVPMFTMNQFTFHTDIDGWIGCRG